MRRLATAVFVLVGALSAGSAAAWATSFVRRPFPEAVRDAPVILRGKIGMSYVDWAPFRGGDRRLYTFTELKVDEAIKGRVDAPTVMMRELGGEKDGRGMQVSGAARFSRGEDVVAMLQPTDNPGVLQLRGLMMGKLDVERGSDGVERLSGPALESGAADGHVHDGGAAPNEGVWTLDRLRDTVREQAAQVEAPASPAVSPPLDSAPSSVSMSASPASSERPEAAIARPDAAAPALQSVPADADALPRRRWPAIVASLLLAAAALRLWRRRRTTKSRD